MQVPHYSCGFSFAAKWSFFEFPQNVRLASRQRQKCRKSSKKAHLEQDARLSGLFFTLQITEETLKCRNSNVKLKKVQKLHRKSVFLFAKKFKFWQQRLIFEKDLCWTHSTANLEKMGKIKIYCVQFCLIMQLAILINLNVERMIFLPNVNHWVENSKIYRKFSRMSFLWYRLRTKWTIFHKLNFRNMKTICDVLFAYNKKKWSFSHYTL